ncbi:MAG: hypothetical protein LBV33_00380, partial [Lachnospiraceae bacterium]|nr:hypothetical protein [Lachnospiraceae bacterium]
DGVREKEDYTKRLSELTARMKVLEEREGQQHKVKIVLDETKAKMEETLQILTAQVSDLAVPLMTAHIEQIIVFNNRIDLYFDFLRPLRPIVALADAAKGRRIFNLCREIGNAD